MERRFFAEPSGLGRYPPNVGTGQVSSPLLLPNPGLHQQQQTQHQHGLQSSQQHQPTQNTHNLFHNGQIQQQTNPPLAQPFQRHPSNHHMNQSHYPHHLQHSRMPHQLHLQPTDSTDPDHHPNISSNLNSNERSNPQLMNRQQNRTPNQQSRQYQYQQMHVSSMPNSLASQTQQQSRPSMIHQQNQFTGLPFSQTPPQVSSLGFTTKSNGGPFAMANSLPQAQQHHMVRNMTREAQHNPNQLPMQNSANVHQGGTDTGNGHNPGFGHHQPLQVQTNLPNQQPSQASFATLANHYGNVMPGGLVDDTTGTAQHFVNSQSGDGLGNAYQWDPSQSQVGVGAQGLGVGQSQQSLIPLVGDTRANSSPRNTTHSTALGHAMRNGSGGFTGALNQGMNVLGSSMNTSSIVGGLGPAPTQSNIANSLSPTGTDLSPRNSLGAGEGGGRVSKVMKKSRATGNRKGMPNRRNSRMLNPGRAPITSPVSTATLPTMKPNPGMNGNTVTSTPSTNSRPSQGGKGKNRMRVGDETQDPMGEGPIGSNSSSAANMMPTQHLDHTTNNTIATNNAVHGGAQFSAIKSTEVSPAWAGRSPVPNRTKTKRKPGDGMSTTVPVHMRNPKRGRARVFRECKKCKKENHIRRSNCSDCKAPLPVGKRRKDGNTMYSKKTPGEQVTNTCIVSQSTSGHRTASKDDTVEASVATM